MLDGLAQVLQRRVGGNDRDIDLLAVGRKLGRAGIARRRIGARTIVVTLTSATAIIIALKTITPLL
jgi:hypothetical protein